MDRSHLNLVPADGAATANARVFLDYTQEALDKAYDQREWAPNALEVIARYTTNSAEVRKTYPPQTEKYGNSDAETLDIFAPKDAKGLPVMVFIHGGAWRLLTKDDSSAPAPTFVDNGCIYIALNFATIPAVRLPDMTEQCRTAISWLYANIARFGGDPAKIFVSGHSSGGHLCGVMLTTDWAARGAPANLIKGGVPMSGMYELYPVLLSARSSYVKVSPEEIVALSSMRHLDRLNCPVIVVNGDKETPEFQRQAREFATVVAGKNHFEVAEELNSASTPLAKAVLAMMKG